MKTPSSHKALFFALVLILITLAVPASSQHIIAQPDALPLLGGGGSTSPAMINGFAIHIPRVNMHVPVGQAFIVNNNWDFSGFSSQAGHFQLTNYPGEGSNVVIGAHYELANFQPGPFIGLDHVVVGDIINVEYNGRIYDYQIVSKFLVTPQNIEVAYPTSSEMLTLMTCHDYASGPNAYVNRLVVQAALVGIR